MEWRTAGGVRFLFAGGLLLVFGNVHFGVGTGRWIMISWGWDIILCFPNFLRSSYVDRELVWQLVYASLLQIIRLRFACGQR